MTSTALAPVLLTYGWVAYMEDEKTIGISLGALSFGLVVVCVGVLKRAQKKLVRSPFKAHSVEACDHENTAFLLLYVMPLFTSQFKSLDWMFWIPTILIFAVITATGYNYHFNPMLGLLGWHFYKVDSAEGVKFVLITKKQLKTAATPLLVGELTEYILLDCEER